MNHMSPQDRASLDHLMSASRRVPRLEREEQLELARQHRRGDKRAGQALVLCNLGLVVQIARHFGARLRGHELDLIQEGSEGLLRALRLFDPDRGVAFTTYAAWWIRAHVFRYVLQNWRLVRIGGSNQQRQIFFTLGREQQRLEARGERADLSVIAGRMGVDPQLASELAQHIGNAEVEESAALALCTPEEQRPDALAERNEELRILRQLVSELEHEAPARERRVIEARWRRDEPPTLRECGAALGVSGERVRQIERDLTAQLRARARRFVEPHLQSA